jgi:protoporphyrinogen oxidase
VAVAPTDHKVVIIGGGPAGLTAAYELTKHGVPSLVLEADSVVGGLARTVNYRGYLFDIGGHRFFTKWEEVNAIWREVLGDKFLTRPRLSRIFYRGRFFHYPLKAAEVLLGLGLVESSKIILSYLKARLFPVRHEQSLEEWVTNRFGSRLYRMFFKTYTEKVWGVPCSEIRSEWAEQRIRGLSISSAVRNALFPRQSAQVKSLIDRFQYPERGPGQMWQELASRLPRLGSSVLLDRPVKKVAHDGSRVIFVETDGPHGCERHYGTDFVSSMPIRELVAALDPPPPQDVLSAAARIRYRDFLIVSLIVNRKDVMPDNWLYIHEPRVRVGRIQNFKNWSPAMVPDPSKTCLGMEYFVFENDDLWSMQDSLLIDLAIGEVERLGLARRDEIEDGTVVRTPKAYPMYDAGYADQVSVIRRYAEASLPNLQLVGRNGMHKYNNQDHSMMTAIYAARNIMGEKNDLWAINTEPEYHEAASSEPVDSGITSGGRHPAYAEPSRISTRPLAGKSKSAGATTSD